ncbi:hypothetical protein HDU98_012222 [Podochytrium sp. JEL0797]|nr:hypothetical protein HDU98_012222 [Podochytrium sp. JEL0797]
MPVLYRWNFFSKHPNLLRNISLVLVFALTVTIAIHVEPHPMTQRRRLMFVDEVEEMQNAEIAYAELMSQYQGKLLPPSHPLYKRTKAITDRLISVVGKDLRPWQLMVVDDPSVVNAMVLPNGKIFVFTGLMQAVWALEAEHQQKEAELHPKGFLERLWSVSKTLFSPPSAARDHPYFTDTLAAVLAHEIAHVLSRHTAEDMGVTQFFQLFTDLAHSVLYTLSLNLPMLSDIGGRALDGAAPYFSTLPYSRLMEMEADVIGLFLMAVAGYNPERASEFWTHLSTTDPTTTSASPAFMEFLSSHPSHTHRAQELAKHEPAALKIYHAHHRIEAALHDSLAQSRHNVRGASRGIQALFSGREESEMDVVNRAMGAVVTRFAAGGSEGDVFWYAREGVDGRFVEESLRVVEEVTGRGVDVSEEK